MPIREKKIYSGDMLEIEIYEIDHKQRKQSRKQKEKLSTPAQRNLNHKNSRKHFARLLNTNFTSKDIHLTLTYRNEDLPVTEEQAKKDVRNFIRRVRYRRKKRIMPELKYLAVIENSGEDKRSLRVHHHIVMTGDMNRDELEEIWNMGRCNSARLQPDERGLEGLAKYLTKERKSGKSWSQSRNLKQPIVRVNDYKFSRRKFRNFSAYDCQQLYYNYRLTSIEKNFNEENGFTSISVLMRRIE